MTGSDDEADFRTAFDRDVTFHDAYSRSTYLDRQSGQILWIYDNDEDARWDAAVPAEDTAADRQRIITNPDHYLKIPGLVHGAHHEILKKFLNSEWTDDEAVKRMARGAYTRSIGYWLKNVGDPVSVIEMQLQEE